VVGLSCFNVVVEVFGGELVEERDRLVVVVALIVVVAEASLKTTAGVVNGSTYAQSKVFEAAPEVDVSK